jgi:hypothetical protein
MKGILPESIRTRTKKLGFPNLDEGWMSVRGQEFISDVVHSDEFKKSPYWDGARIALELDAAFQVQDKNCIYTAWKYVQALCLIRAFTEKKISIQSTC